MQRAARAVLAALLLLAVAPASAPLAAPPGRRDYLACVVLGHHAQRRHHQHLVADLRRARGQRAARRSAERTRLGGDRAAGGRGGAHGRQGLTGHAALAVDEPRRPHHPAVPDGRLHPAAANLVAASALVPLSLAVDGAWPAPWRAPLGWAVVLYAAGPITLGPGRMATFLNLMPFVVIALAWALLGEAVHAYHVVGAALVIAGVVLTTTR